VVAGERAWKPGRAIWEFSHMRGTPVVAEERAWVVCALVFVWNLGFIFTFDLFYVQRIQTLASVIKVPEAQCGNGVRGGAASRGFVRFLGCVWDWII